MRFNIGDKVSVVGIWVGIITMIIDTPEGRFYHVTVPNEMKGIISSEHTVKAA